MRIAYLDLVGGIAGDMWLAALLDAGLPLENLNAFLKRLPGNLRVTPERVSKKGFSALYVKTYSDNFPHLKKYSEIMDFLDKLDIEHEIKEKAKEIYKLLFEAEAVVHGQRIEEVHLHEIAAHDTFVDILGVLFGIKELGIENIYTSSIPLSRGLIESAHGPMPLPAPATLELLKGFHVFQVSESEETVTPTGAVLLKALTQNSSFPLMRLENIGIGAGKRDFETRPNILRLLLGHTQESKDLCWEEVTELETNLDDQPPEVLAVAAEKLLACGALDVGFLPFFMKKGRPGQKLVVLSRPNDAINLAKIMIQETGSLGVRLRQVTRLVVKRKIKEIDTQFGKIRVKIAYLPEKIIFKPELEDLKYFSQKTGRPLRELWQEVQAILTEYKDKFNS